MTIEKAIEWFTNKVEDYLEPVKRQVYTMAISALRAQQEAEKNEPLALDELREMDEEPVYIRMGDGREGYAIIVWECGSVLLCGPDYFDAVTWEPDIDFYGLQYANNSLKESNWNLHQMGWLAYRHKPKED